MTTTPLVSTMIISRPHEPRLGRAIVSALRQHDVDLEVVVVLDGHCDDNRAQIARIADARVRVFEHATPRGRGAARMRAIQEAHGEWLANVDADDWVYASKSLNQLMYLEEHPQVDLLSTGLCVCDRAGHLQGIRGDSQQGVGVAGGRLPALHTPTMMMRLSQAREVGYASACWAGEDRDFLWRFLPHRAWASMAGATYVYDEYASHSLRRCMDSYARRMKVDGARLPPFRRVQNVAINGAKAVLSVGAFAVGQGDWLVERRSSRATTVDLARYQNEQQALQEDLKRYGLV